MSRLRLIAASWTMALLAGCAGSVAKPHPSVPMNESALVCGAGELATIPDPPALPIDLPSGTDTVADVRVEGNRRVPDALVLHGLSTVPGSALDPGKLDSDLIRLHRLGVFADIRTAVETDERGAVVVFRVRERPLVRVVHRSPGSDPVARDEWTSPQSGDVYDAASAHRSADALRRMWQAEGYLDARVRTHARSVSEDRVDLCYELSRGTRWEIERLSFPGASVVAEADLTEVIRKRNASANLPGTPWRPELMEISKLELSALLYDHGLVASRVLQPRVTRDAARHSLVIEIPIEEGPVFRLGKVEVSGKLRGPQAEYRRALGVKPGEVFVRSELLRGFERLQELHRSRGGKPDQVDRNVETHQEKATVDLLVKVGG